MLNLTFQQIEAFMAVAEHLNLTDTAGIMYISQSALSKTISRLERAAGVKLFVRESRGVSLTKEGRYLYEAFQQPFKAMVRAVNEARAMQRRPKRSLRLGLPETYDYNSDYDCIKRKVLEYMELHPDVELSETIYGSEGLKEALLYSEIDMAISQGFVVGALKDVSSVKLTPLGTYLAISARHPLARCEEPPIEGLAGETFYTVQYDSAADMESITRRACAALGFEPKAVKSVPNMASLIRAVGSGRGAALCGRIDRTGPDVQIKNYPLPRYPGFREHSIVAAWRAGQLSREAGELLDMLKELKTP